MYRIRYSNNYLGLASVSALFFCFSSYFYRNKKLYKIKSDANPNLFEKIIKKSFILTKKRIKKLKKKSETFSIFFKKNFFFLKL